MVEAVGDEVTSVEEGDFVSAQMYVAGGNCLQCWTGASHIWQHAKIIRVDGNGAFATRSEEVHRLKASVAYIWQSKA